MFPIIQGKFRIYTVYVAFCLVVKIPKIKICNPFPFRKTFLCDVIDEAMSRVI